MMVSAWLRSERLRLTCYALCWLRKNSATAATVVARNATDMALMANVRMAILTDMAPSWAMVAATAAAAKKGMNIGSLSGLVGEKKKRTGHEDVVLDGEVEGAGWGD